MQTAPMEQREYPQPEQLTYPEWQEPYKKALLELNPEKLTERVAAAEAVILNRLQELSSTSNHHAERRAMEDALAALRVLRRISPGFSAGEGSGGAAR